MNKISLALCTVVIILAAIALFLQPTVPAHAASQFATIVCDGFKPIATTASVQLVAAGNANMYIYVCSLGVGSPLGTSFSIVEGTGTTCATNTVGVIGGTTAAAGIGLAANGTFNEGGGVGAIAKTAVAGDNLCIIATGTNPIGGVLAWTTAQF